MGGSLTSTISVFPLTSVPLKSSHWNSGASTPYPQKITSDLSIADESATCFVHATTSSFQRSPRPLPGLVNVSGRAGAPVIPTSGTGCTYVPSVLPGLSPICLN